jgi:O-antigen/teichoic acid export membrane protein
MGSMAARGGTLACFILLARLLGQAGYGEFALIQSTLGMAGTFAVFGLGVTGSRYVSQLQRTEPERAGRIIGMTITCALLTGIVFSSILFTAAPWLCGTVAHAARLTLSVRLGCGIVLFTALDSAQCGVLYGFESFRLLTRTSAIKALISIPVLAAGIILGGLNGAVLGLGTTAAVGCLINRAVIRDQCRLRGIKIIYSVAASERQILWAYSFPALVSAIAATPAMWLANMILVRTTSGYLELGLFNAANQWRVALAYIPATFSQFALPILSSIDRSRLHGRTVLMSLVWVTGATGVVAIIGGVFGRQLLALFGRSFTVGTGLLSILLITAVISSSNAVLSTAAASSDRMWRVASCNGLWSFALIVAAGALVPRYRGLGLASAVLIAEIISTSFLWVRFLSSTAAVRRQWGQQTDGLA